MKNDHKIKDLLGKLYDEEKADKIFEQIDLLLSEYEDKIYSQNYQISEKDVVLICYGDNVKTREQQPLKTLHHFLDSYLSDIINSVHLLPFYPYSSDDGFSVIDYKTVDPELGSWEDIQELSKDYRLMFDAVINHISQQSDWFQEYLKCNPAYEGFFIETDPREDFSDVVRPRALPLLTMFETAKDPKFIWTTFSADQIDLNYQDPEVLVRVLEVLLFYLSRGAKLLRLDAIAFAWKKPGTPCIHLEETHDLIKLIRACTEEVQPETVIITETNVPHRENISYFGDGSDEAHMVYNFALPPLLAHAIISGTAGKLTAWARSLETPGGKTCFFNFTASHDGVGLRPVEGMLTKEEIQLLVETAIEHGGYISYKSNPDGSQSPYEMNCNYMDLLTHPDEKDDIRAKRMLLAQAIQLSLPGVPGIYFHSLLGSRNYHQGVEQSGQYRSINREKLDLHTLVNALNDPDNLRYKVLEAIKTLLTVRMNESAFNPYSTFDFLDLDPKIFAIQRDAKDHKIIALHNLSAEEISFHLSHRAKTAKDIVSKENLQLPDITLAPLAFHWLSVNLSR